MFMESKTGNNAIATMDSRFNPYQVNINLAQVWVRFYEIPMEFF